MQIIHHKVLGRQKKQITILNNNSQLFTKVEVNNCFSIYHTDTKKKVYFS